MSKADDDYIQTLELAVRLLMSRLDGKQTFTEDELIAHRYDQILFSEFDTLNGATHVIERKFN